MLKYTVFSYMVNIFYFNSVGRDPNVFKYIECSISYAKQGNFI